MQRWRHHRKATPLSITAPRLLWNCFAKSTASISCSSRTGPWRNKRSKICHRTVEAKSGSGLRCDKVGDLWLAVEMKSLHGFLDQAIGIRDPLVLTQVLHPRSDKERLHHPARIGRIFVNTPAECTVS